MYEHNCPLALAELNLCPQDSRLDSLKKSPEDKGSADQPGTENGVSHVFHYPHSHPVLPACKTARWSKGHQQQTSEDGEISQWEEEGKARAARSDPAPAEKIFLFCSQYVLN